MALSRKRATRRRRRQRGRERRRQVDTIPAGETLSAEVLERAIEHARSLYVPAELLGLSRDPGLVWSEDERERIEVRGGHGGGAGGINRIRVEPGAAVPEASPLTNWLRGDERAEIEGWLAQGEQAGHTLVIYVRAHRWDRIGGDRFDGVYQDRGPFGGTEVRRRMAWVAVDQEDRVVCVGPFVGQTKELHEQQPPVMNEREQLRRFRFIEAE